MLSGQEKIHDLLQSYPEAKKVLYKYGITAEAAAFKGYKNLAHAVLSQKLPLKKILDELAAATGEKVLKPKIKIINPQTHPGTTPSSTTLRTGTPEGIKRIIAVHSGKGGVGKTFVSVNLAAALAKSGLKVGILDADVDCPNVMKLLKLEGDIEANANRKMVPLEKFGLKVISMAPILQHEDQALLLRGARVSRVIEQFIHDTAWGKLDVLVIDLPPGTGDIPLSALQILPEAEMIVVTTPHQLGLLDAKKSIHMAKKLNIKILGLVQNMTGEIFGDAKEGKLFAKEQKIKLLATIPMDASFSKNNLDGNPTITRNKKLQNILKKSYFKFLYE